MPTRSAPQGCRKLRSEFFLRWILTKRGNCAKLQEQRRRELDYALLQGRDQLSKRTRLMKSWLIDYLSPGNVIAIAVSLISALTSLYCVHLTYNANVAGQVHQFNIEQVAKFDLSSGEIIDVSSRFISAVNNSGNVSDARSAFNGALAKQLLSVQDLKRELPNQSPNTKAFEDAIGDLKLVTSSASKPEEMRPWAESFGRFLDVRSDLSKSLYKSVGISG